MKSLFQISATLLLLFFAFTLPTSIVADEIDWERAKALRQKLRSGETLQAEEEAYLQRAMDSHQARTNNRDNEATRGDGTDEESTVAPIRVSEAKSPVLTAKAVASDGNEIAFAYRVPEADRPLPAVVFIHGSLGTRRIRELSENARANPTQTRFLAAGYVTVAATFRTYGNEPLSRGPVLDLIAITQAVQELPEVDAESVVVFGTSGGGHIALELAGSEEVSFPAVVLGEPASILFTGLMTSISVREKAMKDFRILYTDKHRKETEAKIDAISCPLLVHHGDQHPLRKINFDLLFPAMEAAGKTLEIKLYPGEDHGFYWGNRTTEETVNAVVANTRKFIEPLLKTKPATSSN